MRGFTLVELILALAFLGIVVFSAVLAFNPLERARLAQDEELSSAAQTLAEDLEEFFIKEGRFPWVDDFASDNPTAPLPWTRAASPEIEVCNESCREFLVGKGSSGQDTVYVCFVPQSEEFRSRSGSLVKASPGEPLPATGVPGECASEVTWKDKDVCYLCAIK